MEESFPRGGKRSSHDKKFNKSGPPAKRRKPSFSTKAKEKSAVGAEAKNKNKSGPVVGVKRRADSSPEPLAALWTGNLTPEICVSDLLTLACVRSTTEHNVLLELPDGLTGILSMENISSVLRQHLLRQHRDSNDQQNATSENIKLSDYFTRGQLICCKIITPPSKSKSGKPQADSSGNKNRRQFNQRFQVTTDPEQVNSILSPADIVEGMVISGAVRSIEEKGYLIDLGLSASSSSSFVGFLPFENCKYNYNDDKNKKLLKIGQVLACSVVETTAAAASSSSSAEEPISSKRVIRLSILPSDLNASSFLDQRRSKEQYSPGLVLNSTVEKVFPLKGLIVRFAQTGGGGGHWRGFVSKWKLQTASSQPTDYKPGQSLKVIVLYTIPNSTVFGVGAQSHLTRRADVDARTDLFHSGGNIGGLIEGSVQQITAKGAVIFQLGGGGGIRKGVFAKAAPFQLEREEDDESKTINNRYSIGSKHRLRIVGYSLFDRQFRVDARKHVFKQPVVDVESSTPGTLVVGTVRKIVPDKGLQIRLYDRLSAFVQLFHCFDNNSETTKRRLLEKHFSIGQTVKGRILRGDLEKNRLLLTLKKRLITSPLRMVIDDFRPDNVGRRADGVVVQINANRGVLVAFYGCARGWLPKTELDKYGSSLLIDAFRLGQVVRVQIRDVDPTTERMVLEPVSDPDPESDETIKLEQRKMDEKENSSAAVVKNEPGIILSTKKKPLVAKKSPSLAVGTLYTAMITKITPFQVNVLIEKQFEGRVFVTELDDRSLVHGSTPLSNYSIGQSILIKVIAIKTKKRPTRRRRQSSESSIIIKEEDDEKEDEEAAGSSKKKKQRKYQYAECTMKEWKLKEKSAKKRAIGYKDEFRKGERIAGVVEEIARRDGVGFVCHVTINPIWKGVVPILGLSTDIDVLRSPSEHFSPGQILIGRIVGIQSREKHLQLTRLSKRQSIVSAGIDKTTRVVITEVCGGSEIRCRLVDGTSGFVPKWYWNDDDDDGKLSEKLFEPGYVLEARPVEKLSNGKWKLKLVKPLKQEAICLEDQNDQDQNDQDKDEFTFESIVTRRKKPKAVVVKEEEPEEDEVVVVDDDGNNTDQRRRKEILEEASAKMKEASKFSWNSGRFSMDNLMGVCLGDRDRSIDRIVDGSGDDRKQQKQADDHDGAGLSNKSTFQRERLEEDQIWRKELSLLKHEDDADADDDQDNDDFDRLVLGSPDSSLLWIRYMAFYLHRAEVSKARMVAERALKTISLREENERFNVWAALLNLEDAYGTWASFREKFDEAIVVNDPLKIYQLATKILRRSNKIEECDAMFEEMLTKFKSEFDVWIAYGDYLMATWRADKSRTLMKRAMNSLPQSKHVDLVSRFAQFEYRYSVDQHHRKPESSESEPISIPIPEPAGDRERGRTLFENILRDYPKRTDVWSVYIDLTSKYQSIQEARPLLERATSLKLNIHNMRLFYKKWLDLEERLGTVETLAQVKKRAAEYVKGSLALLPGGGGKSSRMNDDEDDFVFDDTADQME